MSYLGEGVSAGTTEGTAIKWLIWLSSGMKGLSGGDKRPLYNCLIFVVCLLACSETGSPTIA